jgi:LPXTG-motif cell wall-anchored protein
MRKTFLIFSMTAILFLGNGIIAVSQEQPKPKKDTVNIDSDAKPTFYYAVEDEASAAKKGSGIGTIAIIAIAAGVIVVAAGGFFLLKKKNK